MRTTGAALAITIALPLVSVFASSVAIAQEEPSSADVAAARALGQEGVRLAEAGNCQEAVDKLSRAEKIFHAPTTLARLGECQVQLGKIVDGTENLNKVSRESLAPGAPPAFVAAQERARKVLAEARPKIAKLKIAVAGPQDVTWTVKVDGETMPLANLNTNRPIDPGEHNVEVTAPGYKRASTKVTLTEGGTDSVALTLEPDPNAPKAAPLANTQSDPNRDGNQTLSKPESPQEPPSRAPAYVALGLGVAGVAVGSIFGLMATSKKSDLDNACQNKICGPAQQDDLDSGKTLGTISTVGFIVGGVGLVAGAYLFFTSGSSAGGKAAKSAKSAAARPFVGVDHVGLVF
jgi:hypothetical protein